VSELSVDEFLAALPGDNPAGEPLPFDLKGELEEARKEVDPDSYDPSDPARPTEAKYADWPAIVRIAGRALKEKSKDLLVAARLTEALARVDGFAGLANGLGVMRGMIDQCWDRMYPVIEDGDLEVRAGPFHWLSDSDRGARFPHAVRNVPLLKQNGVALGWRQWKEAQDGKGSLSRDDFEKAVREAPRADCQAAFDALTRTVTELNGLTEALNTRLGKDSPGMTDLRTAVGECYALAKQILDRKGPAPAEGEAPSGAEEASGGDGRAGAGTGRAMASRADVYARLAEAADLLERIEPHSPVPFLIRKAVEFGNLPFPLLMRALIRDENVLTEMNRELGIKPPEGS
jgi:type VI secretion system protein ImpA